MVSSIFLLVLSLGRIFSFQVPINRCRDISQTVCTDLGYTEARFPNGLGHVSVDRARAEFHRFNHILNTSCSGTLKEFLCTVYFPECQGGGKGPLVLPSRKLCVESYQRCGPLLRRFGYEWPSSLNCLKFPGYNNTLGIGSSIRQPLKIHQSFHVRNPTFNLQVRFYPDSITFPSCCRIYHYTGKEIHITQGNDLFVRTADVRKKPTVNFERRTNVINNLKAKYLTLVMVNHYMETISEIKLAFHWVVINIVGADVATGVTIKEFSAPKPSIETSDTYHFLLFEHAKPLDIFSKEILRQKTTDIWLGDGNEYQLVAAVKMKVSIDEYVRFRETNEFNFPAEEVCRDVKHFEHGCQGAVRTFSVNR